MGRFLKMCFQIRSLKFEDLKKFTTLVYQNNKKIEQIFEVKEKIRNFVKDQNTIGDLQVENSLSFQ